MHDGIAIDSELSLVHLTKTEGKYFYVLGKSTVFLLFKIAINIEKQYQRQGFGKFLIQVAAQIAASEEARKLECNDNTLDTTEKYSNSGTSLYVRALGKPKVRKEEYAWFIPLDSHTPVDGITDKLLI